MNNKELDDILNDPIFDINDKEKELFDLPESIKKGRAKKSVVVDAIEKYGFDSKVFANKICNLYLESMSK